MDSLGVTLRNVIDAMAQDLDFATASQLAVRHIEVLLERPDLLASGIQRRGFHVAQSSWLYYDPEYSIAVAKISAGSTIPTHNHGTWEIVAPYVGSLRYTAYESIPDPDRPGHAELKVLEERVLNAGDISLVPPPPCDVHGWSVLTDTYLLAIVGPGVLTNRTYYEEGTSRYFEREASWPAVE